MKKMLIAMAVMLFTVFSFAEIAYAAKPADEDTVGDWDDYYESTLEFIKVERTDLYALDYYRHGAYWDDPLYVKWAKKITAGITDDYEKAKAIFNWVYENTRYAYGYDLESSRGIGLDEFEKYGYMQMLCVGYALLTQNLLNAAGLPAKTINGIANNLDEYRGLHDWNEVYVDNRWVYVDSTWGEFDLPVSEWGRDHYGNGSLVEQDKEAWDGSLYFVDLENGRVLKEVKEFPLNGVVNSTYGFDIKDLYFDNQYTKPFKLGKMKVNGANFGILVKFSGQVRYSVVDPDGYIIDYEDSFYNNFDYNYVKEEEDYIDYSSYRYDAEDPFYANYGQDYYTTYYSYIQRELPPYFAVPEGELLKQPIDPVLKGYTFIGWYNAETGKKWNFASDKFTEKHYGMILQSRWKKAAKSYKVTFSTNRGTSLKSLIMAKDSRISRPVSPMRKGYRFTGWYKDAKCTTKWNFTKDKVTAAATLYAGWEKTYTVTCNANGGTGVFDIIVKANTLSTEPIATIRSGYTFTGWYKDSDCTTKWDFETDKVTENITLYAGWNKE